MLTFDMYTCRFPSTTKVSALKLTRAEPTAAKSMSSLGKTSPPQSNTSKPESDYDVV